MTTPLLKVSWADGSPAIDVSSYQCTQRALTNFMSSIARHFKGSLQRTVWSLDEGFADVVLPSGEMFRSKMDTYSFSISCPSEAVRDQLYDHLSQQPVIGRR